MMMQMGWCLRRVQARHAPAANEGRAGRLPKHSDHEQAEIRKMVAKRSRTAADAARLFKVHAATVSRLLARRPAGGEKRGKPWLKKNKARLGPLIALCSDAIKDDISNLKGSLYAQSCGVLAPP
jgi:hypothetical protein